MQVRGVLERYGSLLSLPSHAVPLSLCEGSTPLIPVPALAERLGGGFELYVKFEGLNPVSEAKGKGAETLICASTGNTAASAAAYAARAGMKAVVLIPEGKVARGKLAASAMYGAKIIQVEGSFDDALSLVQELAAKRPIALVNSVNPYRLEGQKTAAFEIVDELGTAPDLLALPVGNAGNISAYYMGFEQYRNVRGTSTPILFGVQAEGAAPLVLGRIVEKPETVATAIRIGNPARGAQALEAAKNSGGRIIAASDSEILAAQKLLASEGIWVEPASAAGLAGLLKDRVNLSFKGKKVVIVCTGHGLKDPDIVEMPTPERIIPSLSALEVLL